MKGIILTEKWKKYLNEGIDADQYGLYVYPENEDFLLVLYEKGKELPRTRKWAAADGNWNGSLAIAYRRSGSLYPKDISNLPHCP